MNNQQLALLYPVCMTTTSHRGTIAEIINADLTLDFDVTSNLWGNFQKEWLQIQHNQPFMQFFVRSLNVRIVRCWPVEAFYFGEAFKLHSCLMVVNYEIRGCEWDVKSMHSPKSELLQRSAVLCALKLSSIVQRRGLNADVGAVPRWQLLSEVLPPDWKLFHPVCSSLIKGYFY